MTQEFEAREILKTIGEDVVLLNSPGLLNGEAVGGRDFDCVAERVDPYWPLRQLHQWMYCQKLQYDVYSWYWVLFRQGEVLALDVTADLKGVGRYRLPTRSDWRSTYDPGPLEAAYLTSKRLYKKILDNREWERIAILASSDPAQYSTILGHMFGSGPAKWMSELGLKGTSPSISEMARANTLRRLSRLTAPMSSLQFSVREVGRVLKRILRPTGLYVVVVGPDGAGKSTLAEGLALACDGLFRRYEHHHWRPGLLPRPGGIVGVESTYDPTNPHGTPIGNLLRSFLRLIYYWLDFTLGYLLLVYPGKVRTGLFILERGWWDMGVDQRRYGLNVPRIVHSLLSLAVPSPDLTIVLEASVSEMLRRKREVTPEEITRQTSRWRGLGSINHVFVDADMSTRAVMEQARQAIVDKLEHRVLRNLGTGWISLPNFRNRRWILPRGPRKVVLAGLRVYTPLTRRSRIGWEMARVIGSVGAFRLIPRGPAPQRRLLALLSSHLEAGETLALNKGDRPARWTAFIIKSDGEVRAVAKLALDDQGRMALANEVFALTNYAAELSAPLTSANVLAHSKEMLLLAPVKGKVRFSPWLLPSDVAYALGSSTKPGVHPHAPQGLSHGDFTPWNLLLVDSRSWVVIDWEDSSIGFKPFHDIFHFFVQSSALLGRPSSREIFQGLLGVGYVGSALAAFAEGAETDIATCDIHLRAYLKKSMARLDPHNSKSARGKTARMELLELLGPE